VHRAGSTFEDGIPGLDPDVTSSCGTGTCSGGTRDGLACSTNTDCPEAKDDKLRWEAGSVHVASDNYIVTGPFDSNINAYRPFELTIEPGAIVKISSICTTDGNGEIISCQPQAFGGGQIYVYDGSVLKIQGATITDIRDDSVGGDTNKDGSATTPAPSYLIRFGGSPEESLVGSTVKYAALVGHFGSMPVEGNVFLKSGGAGDYQGSSIYNTHPPVRGSVPSIVDNFFEIVSGTPGPGALDVRGQSAIVWGNEFTGNAGAVVIGPTWENLYEFKNALPEDGVTVVAHNDITSKDGIVTAPATATSDKILQQVRFRADIHDNRLVGPVGGGNVGLGISLFSETTASWNTVENYSFPFQLRTTGAAFPPSAETAALIDLDVHSNSFSLTGAQFGPIQNNEAFWKDFDTVVDAENNWWGHATGPKDASNTDGLVNARGLGLLVSNGIDYAPFFAGEATLPRDSIHLTAGAFPPPPLVPNTGDVLLNVTVDDYTLASASTGTVTISVRDSQGTDLVTPVSKTVSSSNHQVEFETIALPAVPRFTSAVVVEAALVPDSPARDEVRSKPKLFPVARPAGAFFLQCIDDNDVTGDCDPVDPQPGNTSNLALRFWYKFAGTVHGHVTLEERTESGHDLVRTFPTINFTASASPSGTSIVQFTSYQPLLTGATDPPVYLQARYWAEDDGGVEIWSGTRAVQIFYSNRVQARVQILDTMLNKRMLPFAHLLVGGHPHIEIDLYYDIGTKNVTNWRVVLTPVEAVNADDFVLHTYDPGPAVLLNNLPTGSGVLDDLRINLEEQPGLPPGTTLLRFRIDLLAPDQDLVVTSAEVDIPVRNAEAVVTKSIPAGPSSTSFPPLPVKLEATANPSAGVLVAEEILGALTKFSFSPESQPLPAANDRRGVAETRLIPLNRHYSLYDTLSDSGLTATVTFGYDPSTDFPDDPGFDEDALVVAALNPLSGALEVLPSTHDQAQHTVTAAYDSFFADWTVASETTAPAASCADPTADGKTTAADALRALRAGVGITTCELCVCDVNKNGSVSSSDALLILRVAVGQLPEATCLPCL
jgi:hypothetical protein